MKYAIRVWHEQTLYDSRDYWVEADSPEEAALLMHDLTGLAAETGAPASNPCVTAFERGQDDVIYELDPREVVDGCRGVTLLDADGDEERDMIGVPTGQVPLGKPIEESAT